MRSALLTVLRAVLFLVLAVSSAAVLYATDRTAENARGLAEEALESTALALSASAENALRAGGGRETGEVREILSDRVVAYALIASRDGTVLFHTNPRLAGTRIPEPFSREPAEGGKGIGRRVTLGTGIPAYEYDYLLRGPGGTPELLRLVLHTARADAIASGAQRMWWTVGGILALLWTVGILLERVVAGRVRRAAEAERQERMAMIGRMTSTLAHEIRNALGSVKGFAQLVDEKTAGSDPRKAGISVVLQGAGRIEAIVNDLLLFSREETYRADTVDVAGLVREVVRSDASAWGGDVEISLAPDSLAAADGEMVRRVLANGVRNALQAMGASGRLEVASRREGKSLAVTISDTGPGIPPQETHRLFTPFHTTKPDGTGLGLAYSKKAVEGMGGRIDLSNRHGGGAVLTILLPAAEGMSLGKVRPDRR
ncbi:MAG TPA: ATP-binding protein [Candidatus Aquicultoraceae bacterium]|nr:ATP-binding protein [Candidatus Aquicultoraceae bacterium]